MRRIARRTLAVWVVLAALAGLAPLPAWAVQPGQLIREVLVLVEREHVDAELLIPATLLEGALAAVSSTYPDVTHVVTQRNARIEVRVRAGSEVFSHGGAQPRTILQLRPLLERVHTFLLTSLHPVATSDAVLAPMLNGLLGSADHWSRLLNREEHDDFQRTLASRYGGVGLRVKPNRGVLNVHGVLPGSAAARAGIRPGDHIERIGLHPAYGIGTGAATAYLRGEPGVPVTLRVARRRGAKTRTLNLVRREIHIPSVESQLLAVRDEAWVGYLRISEFVHDTGTELTSHLARLYPESPGFLGIIIDLRGNPGGVVEQATRATDRFLNRGVITELVRNQSRGEQVRARGYGPLTTTPLVVLMDKASASGAELMAAALRNNRRAVLIGQASAGKGSVQTIIPVGGRQALRLTTARFLAPGGETIPAQGLQPDLVLAAAGLDPRGRAFGLLAPSRPGAESSGKSLAALQYLDARPWWQRQAPGMLPQETRIRQRRLETDFHVAFAKQVLVANRKRDYGALLRTALALRGAERHRQQRNLESALARQGKKWSAAGGREKGRAIIEEILLETNAPGGQSGDTRWRRLQGALRPGGQLRITLTAANRGAAPVPPLVGLIRSESPLFAELQFPIGRLASNQRGSWSTVIDLPPQLPHGQEHLTLELLDRGNQVHQKASLLINMQPQPPPRLLVKLVASPSRRKETSGSLRVRLKNIGPTAAPRGIIALQRNPETGRESDGFNDAEFPPLAPGRYTTVRIAYPLDPRHGTPGPPRGSGEAATLTLHLFDADSGAIWLMEEIRLPAQQEREVKLTLQPPIVDVNLPARPTTATSFTFSGSVRDDQSTRMILVRVNGEQVFQRFQGSRRKRLKFSTPIHLREGRNVLEVHAWDNQRLETIQRVVLWRGNRLEVAGSDGLRQNWR